MVSVPTMQLANRFSIKRRSDHFILRFGFADSDEADGAEVAQLAVPITLGIDVATSLFEAMLRSIYDLNREIGAVQKTMDSLNQLGKDLKAKVDAEAQAGSTRQEG